MNTLEKARANTRRLLLIFSWSICLLFSSTSFAISLEEYLKQVESKNQSIESANLSKKASETGDSEAAVLTSPQFFTSAQVARDKSPTLLGDLQGTDRRGQTLQSGFQSQTDFGVQGRLYFSHDQQRTLGSSFVQPGQEQIDLQSYNLELKLPLWQNGFGRDLRLQKSAIKSQAKAEGFQADFDYQSTIHRAESTYYRLSRLQEEVQVLSGLVDQGEKLVSWARTRVGSRLLEKSNLTESQAAFAGRELELKGKQLEYEDALRDFNSIREFPLDTKVTLSSVKEVLSKVSRETSIKATFVRLDLRAQEQLIDAEKKSLERALEALKPKLDLSTRFASFTKQSDLNDTRRCTSTDSCSQVVLGLNFEMPLDFGSVDKASAASRYRIQAREASLNRARTESDSQLNRLRKSFELLDAQILASEQLLKAQSERLKEERSRQRLGRGSTFDVIRAEQDYSQSELTLLALQFSKLDAISQLRLFVSPEEK